MRAFAFVSLFVAFLAGTTNASLGPFSLTDPSNPSNSLSLQDGDRVLLDATPTAIPAPNILWSPFKTNDFTGSGGSPNLSIDINNGGTALAMQKVTVQYFDMGGVNVMRLLDLTNRDGNPDMEIQISNVIVPGSVDLSSTPDEFMIDPANSVLTYIQDGTAQFSIAAVPEPSAFIFGGLVVGLVGVRRVIKKRRAAKTRVADDVQE